MRGKGLIKIFCFFCIVIILEIGVLLKGDILKIKGEDSLISERLEFDSEGNLVMVTRDKKATTNIRYKTIGWVIKRYDMPINAVGQQYAIIPADNHIEYVNDEKDSRYVYCYYYGNKEKIAKAIGSVSSEWKNQLYKYGDYVYIDEIITIIQNGHICGGLQENSVGWWGEVYFTYEGIAGARAWAAKESLKTHFNKSVYFKEMVKPKYFNASTESIEKVVNTHKATSNLDIGEGTRFKESYDVTRAVPTGSSLYIKGEADRYEYTLTFNRKKYVCNIPIRLLVTYTLRWKDYKGNVCTEKKVITQWYYVTRKASYYEIENIKLWYLDKVVVNNYGFDNGVAVKQFEDMNPVLNTVHRESTAAHIQLPVYQDTYYIDGGIISQMNIKGVKPSVPEVDRQKIVNNMVGDIKARNDYIKIDDVLILSDQWNKNTTYAPHTGNINIVKSIYSTGYKINHNRQNMQQTLVTGYAQYKEYNSEKVMKKQSNMWKTISIHTPVYVDVAVVQPSVNANNNEINDCGDNDKSGEINNYVDNDKNSEINDCTDIMQNKEFCIEVNTSGKHIDEKGYGERDYKSTTDKIEVCFDKDIMIKAEGKDGYEKINANTWITHSKSDVFMIEDGMDEGIYNVQVRAYAKNYRSPSNVYDASGGYVALNKIEELQEENANLDYHNYVAYSRAEFNVIKNIYENKKIYEIVGTH